MHSGEELGGRCGGELNMGRLGWLMRRSPIAAWAGAMPCSIASAKRGGEDGRPPWRLPPAPAMKAKWLPPWLLPPSSCRLGCDMLRRPLDCGSTTGAHTRPSAARPLCKLVLPCFFCGRGSLAVQRSQQGAAHAGLRQRVARQLSCSHRVTAQAQAGGGIRHTPHAPPVHRLSPAVPRWPMRPAPHARKSTRHAALASGAPAAAARTSPWGWRGRWLSRCRSACASGSSPAPPRWRSHK